MVHFNPPPNWPELPDDFVPPAGWQPDPRWGPVPYGWALWIDDEGRPATATVPLMTPVPVEVRSSWFARNWGIALGVALVIIAVAVGSVAYGSHEHQVKLVGHQVTYAVTTSDGTSAYDIDYATAGGSQQATHVSVPWSYSAGLRAIGATAALYLSAQHDPSGAGTITCTITVDGRVAASNTSSGAAAIATCEALIH